MRAWLAAATVLALGGCAAPPAFTGDEDRVQVVTTTGILADLVRNVGGDRVLVDALVPDNADPHGYEPTLRDVRNTVYADLAFSNYLLLEPAAVIKALDANLRAGVPNISLAEGATTYAAEIIPLVEDVSLDTIWLGLRAHGTGARFGATRSSDVRLTATGVEGPGELTAYLTGSFGKPEMIFHGKSGTAVLPADAHTHMSWAFTEPGIYRLTLRADLAIAPDAGTVPLGPPRTFTFAVGVDPHSVNPQAVNPQGVNPQGADVLGQGHADLAVDIDTGALYLHADPDLRLDPATTVIEVPAKALQEIPGGTAFRFLGRGGERVYQLPQAVLGRHVHGEIDPHLWQDAGNAQAYTELIRDTLIGVDPAGTSVYRANADRYLSELTALDAYLTETIASIPVSRRHLVTTHDAFGYLAHAYGIPVAGFVTPNPAAEPSLADRRKLTETLRTLRIPAVFLEPNLRARSSTLVEVAREQGVAVCDIYGDAFDDRITTYLAMMRFNADSLKRCLS
ncbi:anchored repeat ABC transporter, substrate-binding protein [Catenuloplanes japonicus]|uniref:anchored repeat ABC transporter, substrate-binding protein n=1 Tax=Catenuloplanes japonicus TaxID=33876 RepID=UPI0005273185|nr:anchored repeat ABC transporter, substrate-binding protein [Catenuloplanes japonicus]